MSTKALIRGLQRWLVCCGQYRMLVIEMRETVQPSCDRATQIAFDDFDTNSVGTLNLLETARRWTPESPFIHISMNTVYGDRPPGSTRQLVSLPRPDKQVVKGSF